MKRLLPLLLLMTACQTLTVDKSMSAIEAGAPTALIALKVDPSNPVLGCGVQPVPGLTKCLVMEGPLGKAAISFIGPPASCDKDKKKPCTFFKIYYPTGEPAYADSIPNGLTSKDVPWATLLHSDQFRLGDRGFWSFNYETHWLDDKGRDMVTYSQGEIILRVYKQGYESLEHAVSDPNFAWEWIQDGYQIKMTTGARTFVETK